MKLLITICARGGSKGIPGKNIKILNGRPLIDYSVKIAQAMSAKHNGYVALSTDDDEIIRVAADCGLKTAYRRPEALATDVAGKIDAIRDLLKFEETQSGSQFDYVLDLDITSPLRTLEDVETAFRLFVADANALTLFSVNTASRNPYFNMVEKKANGYYYFVKTSGDMPLSRQSAPAVYELNASFYFYRRAFFDSGENKAITLNSVIYQMPHICFDLDHPVDFEFLDFLLQNSKLDFQLL